MKNPHILVITVSSLFIDEKYTEGELKFAFIKEHKGKNRKVAWDDVEEKEGHVSGVIQELFDLPEGTTVKEWVQAYLDKNRDWTHQECFGVYTLEGYFNCDESRELITESDF
jgi:hypothetical protein